MKATVDVSISGLKRCSIASDSPPVIVSCPDCGSRLLCDLGTLYYPTVGAQEEYVAHCALCKKEWWGLLTISRTCIVLELDEGDLVGRDDEVAP